ncbi:Cell morphogenesis protein Sog2, putative [Penicillium digitatum]|uniref:Cell morphogenesis protein Sog2, putative n=3 Tax=Penicillium digitatum TaxID=36651 RepID=K9H3G2_PEND2|nr:Cell morphogenesis protein Sog2, putative [Penicillium digitatum Pd1]EKV19696.1 Cell morphogenesis protein Sog2, putative [Penicillium digitatum PHI26]EKV20808.1 Cell morphogenesis protein Sog2, putative [Penicillium digitatum Pd1]QQK44780.1 Cell morphogenesis protein Sog2, putative [Penicillium digitatum]
MASSMIRSEETMRGPRLSRGETDEDETENGTLESGGFLASQSDDFPYPEEGSRPNTALGDVSESTSKQPTGPKTLSPEETIELARNAVESGIQDTKRSLAGSEAVTDVVKPKLTIDLGHSHIARIPEPVVDLIKDEVERLSLSNNQLFHIPYRFAECSHLRYLNIRANNFREFPKGVYKLPLLEILDLSRNKIKELPNEISKLKSLRVLSVMQNRLTDLPVGLSEMHKLQIFKCIGNPLRKPLRDILEETENDATQSGMTDNEKEVAATTKLKRFLKKTRQQTSTPEPEIVVDTSDGALDIKPVPTPIPSKRNLSGRFPVIPSTGDSSANSSRSPSISRAPPIPIKSHYRMASGQQGATYHLPGLQRPGVAPYSVNERNRSNSEGIIQGSSVARSKRMGLITRKNTDLGTLDETRPYRNSHLRGLSHGSMLLPRQAAPPVATNDNTPPSPTSPRERRWPRDGWVNRMSSLPEHKSERGSDEPIIKSAKGILFALAQVHSHIDTLINVIKHDDTRRHSLELVFYNASSHVDQLNEAIEKASNALWHDSESIASVTETVKRECETCISAYIHVGTQLRNNVAKIVSNGDPRYVRSLMLTMFGSLVELRNACAILNVPLQTINKRGSATKRLVCPSNPLPSVPDRSQPSLVTPTRDPIPPNRRLRSDTTIRHPQYPMTMISNQTSISSPGFIASYARSRSSSRSNVINTSMPHSLATPRSGESFPPMPVPGAPRVNTLTGLDENEEERIFEKIFHQLTATYHAAYGALPLARRQFIRCLEAAQRSRDSEGIQILWNNLIRRCQFCLEVSDALGQRLSTMKIKEPGGGLRNQREFWQLCKSFMQSFVDLVNEMRELRSMQLLPADVIILLRPVQKASREAGRLIEVSPWAYLADPDRHLPPSNLYGPPLQIPHLQHHQISISTSALTNNPSFQFNMMSPPQSITVPATPLSAALGPAAQATVPSTPASAYSDKFFEGDVFQRADSLLSSNQAPFFRR